MRMQQNHAVLSLVLVGLIVGLVYLAVKRPETQPISNCNSVEKEMRAKRSIPFGYRPDDIELNKMIDETAEKSGDCQHQSIFDAGIRSNTRGTDR